MMILDSLGKPPQSLIKTNTFEGGSMEIEFYFKFVRKPKTKKVTLVVKDEG